MTQAEMVEHYSNRITRALDDLKAMALVDELWEEYVTALRAIADALEGAVTGTVDTALLAIAING